MQELIQREPPDFAGFRAFGTGVINDIGRIAQSDLALAEINHTVKGYVIRRAAVKENVSRLSISDFARDEKGVPAFQGLGIGEFSKSSIVQVSGRPWAGADAKQRGAQRRVRVMVLSHGFERGDERQMRSR